MAEAVVPFPLLLGIVYPNGQRLPKRKAFVLPQATKPTVTIPPTNGYQPFHRIASGPEIIVPGNLPNDDYLCFYGSVNVSASLANCRVCNRTACNTEERKEHLSKGACKEVTLAIRRALNTLGVCAVCGKRTPTRVWGFPICGGCLHAWKFLTPRRDSPFALARFTALKEYNKETLNANL